MMRTIAAMSRRLGVVAVVLGALVGCGGSGPAVCAKYAECAPDPPGADFQSICESRYRGEINALRANDEQECRDLADAKEAFDACRATMDCNDFNDGDYDPECEDEFDHYAEAFDDADNDFGTYALREGSAGPYLPTLQPEKCTAWD